MKKKTFSIVARVMGVPVAEIDEETSPDTLAAWDSLKHLNLVLALEEEFDVQFSDEQVVDMLNVQLIVLALEEAGAHGS